MLSEYECMDEWMSMYACAFDENVHFDGYFGGFPEVTSEK